MSGSNFANFSTVSRPVRETLDRIEEHLSTWNCELTDAGGMRREGNNYQVIGDELMKCSREDIDRLTAGTSPFGFSFAAYTPRARLAVAFTDITEHTHTVAVELDRALTYFADDDYPRQGAWMTGLLTSLTAAVGAEVCAAIDTSILKDKNISIEELTELLQRPRYQALDPDAVLDRLRNGDLLELPGPVFHALAVDMIETSEIKFLMKRDGVANGTRYAQAPGYHVIANIGSP